MRVSHRLELSEDWAQLTLNPHVGFSLCFPYRVLLKWDAQLNPTLLVTRFVLKRHGGSIHSSRLD